MKELVMFFLTLIATSSIWTLSLFNLNVIELSQSLFIGLTFISFISFLYILYRLICIIVDNWE